MEEQAARFLALGYASTELAKSEWRTGILSSALEAPRNYSRLTYSGFTPSKLAPVNEPMKVVLHVSPDRGWPMLRSFLSPADGWIIAMFDFTARHIFDRLCEAASGSSADLSLCLGPNEFGRESSKPTGISEGDIVDALRDKMGARFHFAWASVGIRREFPSAYHIKVAVRDRSAVWLSSGNWQSTNQPLNDFPPGADAPSPKDAREMARGNREWHVIIENPTVAGIFADYIEKDRKSAELEGVEEGAGPIEVGEPPFPADDEFTLQFRVPIGPLVAEEEAPRLPQRTFPERVIDDGGRISVQPILSPDNYAEHALELIGKATKRLWFQNQSLVIGQYVVAGYRALLNILKKKLWEIDDSRIVIRDLIRVQTLDALRMLDRDGFPMQKVRVMKTCHTKGILVDSRWTLVGSHNWTNEGTLYNRDASLLFDDARVTQYFEEVLDHDWRYLAVHLDVDPAVPSAILPRPGETIPGETVTVDPRLDRLAD
jgi:phosphatidylserine/phosphatidylglycerophosphate/cardiolipin synthase-like enzyme